jgi:hypothetical protein
LKLVTDTPKRGAVDDVVGDKRALEAELGIERDLAEAGAGVADDLQVRRRVAAHRREGGVADAVAAHDDIAGAEDIDSVAVLAGAAGPGGNVLDAVVDDERAIIAGRATPDQNAAIAGAAHRVAGNAQAARVEREDANVSGADDVSGDGPLDRLERNAVAAGIHDLALGDMHGAALGEMQKAAPLGKRDPAAVENKAGDGNVVACGRRQQRSPPDMTMRVAPGVPEIAA